MGFSEAAPEGNSSHQKVQKISEGKNRIQLKNEKEKVARAKEFNSKIKQNRKSAWIQTG